MTQLIAATAINNSDNIKSLLNDPIFRKVPYMGMARIVPYISERVFEPGQILYTKGTAADNFFYLLQGRVKLISNGREIEFDCHRVGQEAGTDFDHYLTDAVASSRVTALVIPKKNLWSLFESVPKLRAEIYFSLIKIFAGDHIEQDSPVEDLVVHVPPKGSSEGLTTLIGWLITTATPVIVLYFGSSWGIDRNSTYFLAILSSSIVMWVFSLVDEYIPGLFVILTTLAMQLVPMTVILSGLASDGFMLAMSVLGLSVVIVNSGLNYRILLLMLKNLPNSPFWQNLSMLFMGFALTPLIPSINGRVALVTPLMMDMMEILHQEPKSLAANKLAISTFTGVSLLSGIFLSSKSVNFVILGLLPDQIQDQYQWLSWFAAGGVTGIVLLVLHFGLESWLFHGVKSSPLSKEQIAVQLALLGNMKQREWAGFIGVVLFVIGIFTVSLHQIPSPWIGLSILFGILLFGALKKSEFREKIDWPFLIYLGSIVGITSSINYLGLGKLIASMLPWLGEDMNSNFYLFVLILAAIIFVIRLVVPISATIVILATILMPVAVYYGTNPWVVGFIILVIGEMWFFPYQCSYYLQYRQITKGRIFNETTFLTFNALSNISKIVALFASIPYWKWMGLL